MPDLVCIPLNIFPMSRYLALGLVFLVSAELAAQDTVATRSIEEAIHVAKAGSYVSLAILTDSNEVFPEAVFEIPRDRLVGLILDNVGYRIIPERLAEFQELMYFRYSWFLFFESPNTQFPRFLLKLPKIRFLTIEGIFMDSVPEEIGQLKSLRGLDMYYCKLPDFPRGVLELDSLETLQLSCNRFDSIPEDINRLKNLKTLHFEGGACGSTPIIYVPETLGDLKKLKAFSLGYTETGLKALPERFYELSQLETFECNGCGLPSLSEKLSQLQALESISLINMKNFEAFPEAFFELPNLKKFRFHQYGAKASPGLIEQKSRIEAWGQALESFDFALIEKD